MLFFTPTKKGVQRLKTFIQKFSHVINGFLTGFDRIIFKGSVLAVMHENGAESFCALNGILNKDFKGWMLSRTADIVAGAQKLCMTQCGEGITHVNSSRLRKESLAHERQRVKGITSGLIGVWSAVESCVTFKASYDKVAGHPRLIRHWGKCKHLYFYYDHERYGFMSIRLQTWFPYHIQIAMNGREWLRRSLETAGVEHTVSGNKFFYVQDFNQAQAVLDTQRNTHWQEILESFLPEVFPSMRHIFGDNLSYYWTHWQSEMATDVIFKSPCHIKPFIDTLMRYAFMTGNITNIMRYMDRPLTAAGKPRANCADDVKGRCISFNDGLCLRCWLNGNSVKTYNERNVIRVETTINNPSMFKAHRQKKGDSPDAPKKLRALRKSVADVPLTSAKAAEVNERFMHQLAQCEDQTPASETFAKVCQAKQKSGKRVRALDLTGKDHALLKAIANPKFSISGITNKALRETLADAPGYAGKSEKQISAKITRHNAGPQSGPAGTTPFTHFSDRCNYAKVNAAPFVVN